MKLLICSLYNPEKLDGVSSSTQFLVKLLRKSGVDVTVCTTDGGWSVNSKIVYKEENVFVFPAHCNNDFNLSFPLARFLKEKLRNFDLVYFNNFYSFSTFIGTRHARKYGIPYCVSPRGNFLPVSIWARNIKSPIKKRLYWKLFLKKLILNAEYIICSSNSEVEAVKSHMQKFINYVPISSIPDGIDTGQLNYKKTKNKVWHSLGLDPHARTVLFLGRLSNEKALTFLLDVWEQYAEKRHDSQLVLAGYAEKKYNKVLNNKLSRMKNKDCVIFTGPVFGSVKNSLLAFSDCLVLPSYFESFGIVVLEALYCGTAVITSHGTQWKELQENRLGFRIDWDIDQWIDSINKILDSQYFNSILFAEKAKDYILKNYAVEVVAKKFLNIFQKAAGIEL